MNKEKEMDVIFRSRPFKIRNADEYDISNVLGLFVSPINGLATPFDYENSIIKGRMGSGKTMYLRANYAYYISALVPSLIDKGELVLPVFIRLSDFQHFKEPSQIYSAIIVKIIEELASIYLHLEDAKELASLQSGIKGIPSTLIAAHKFSSTMKLLAQLGSEEYIERVTTELGIKSGIKPKFIEVSSEWKKTNFVELKSKPNPGIKDVEECYKNLLEGKEGKILLLIDEAGSLDNSFFSGKENSSFFEVLMNQFRTASFIRTKIAVYPHSYSDMLTETRYGDAVILEDDILTTHGYERFRLRTLEMISNYLNPNSYEEKKWNVNDFFDLSAEKSDGDAIEQIIYASNGNMRRMMQLLDLTLEAAYLENNQVTLINKKHATQALTKHANNSEAEYNQEELELLHSLVNVCKARGAYKFNFPNTSLYKYTNRSEEYNLINVIQLGSGSRATIYGFDYSYSVSKDIPTHRMLDSEKVYHERSLSGGRWLTRLATINDELITNASLPGKIEGSIVYLSNEQGFIKCEQNQEYYFTLDNIIKTDKSKKIFQGKRMRFYPTTFDDTKYAVLIEVL